MQSEKNVVNQVLILYPYMTPSKNDAYASCSCDLIIFYSININQIVIFFQYQFGLIPKFLPKFRKFFEIPFAYIRYFGYNAP